MKNSFPQKILVLIMMLISFNSFACDCECDGDCSFSVMAQNNEFVALVKVIEYSSYLDRQILGYDKKMPLSMTVEIIKKYKGAESRQQITIWGDNGAQCRPYLSEFEVGECYLIAPTKITQNSKIGGKEDYDFFSCSTDYLRVDLDNGIAYGEYSKKKEKILLETFESELKK